MTHNSKRAWSLITKQINDPCKADQHVNVTPNQVAHQLILNGKVPNRQRQSKIKRCGQENHDFHDDFTTIELHNSLLKHLKNGKAAGLDEILIQEIKNFGPVTMQWVLSLLNACTRTHTSDAVKRFVALCRAFTRLSNARESVSGVGLLVGPYTVPAYTSHAGISARQRAPESVAKRNMLQSSTVLNFRASRQQFSQSCIFVQVSRIEFAADRACNYASELATRHAVSSSRRGRNTLVITVKEQS